MREPSTPGPGCYVALPPDLIPVRIQRRLHRFAVEVRLVGAKDSSGSEALLDLHLPNSGRMEELLAHGTPGLAVLDGGGKRKTAGTLLLVRYNDRWVSVDSRMPNRLFARCIAEGHLPPFRGYDTWRAEAPLGKGRIDFQLSKSGLPDFLVETKSCNLVEDGLALFPDAPTQRGTRHVMDLIEARRDGLRAAVVWFVQRDDARRLAPHHAEDPAFAQAVGEAHTAGVEFYAFGCDVKPTGIRVVEPIPVVIPGSRASRGQKSG